VDRIERVFDGSKTVSAGVDVVEDHDLAGGQ
jgi:hypothetical protein